MSRFLMFLIVGTCGFAIDATITQIMLNNDYAPAIARLPAIFCALLFTWLANRGLTFRVSAEKSTAEMAGYAATAVVLAGVNYITFLVFVSMGLTPFLALAVTAVLQIFLSFQVQKKFFSLIKSNRPTR
jgi:putative flippase GtrA